MVLVRFLVVPVEDAFTGDASVSLETSVILSASAAKSSNSVFVEEARILLTSWGSWAMKRALNIVSRSEFKFFMC